MDVTRRASVEQAVQRVVGEFGRLDVAVVPATSLAQFYIRAIQESPGRVRVPMPPDDCLKPFYGLTKFL